MSGDRLNVVRAMAALAWADGYLDREERGKILGLAGKMGLSEVEMGEVRAWLEASPSLDEISFGELSERERQAMYLLALHSAYLDDLVWSGEREVLARLAEMLEISPEVREKLEEQVRERKSTTPPPAAGDGE
jgi:uncharacterized membrane protein YebE (DUF533 family)